jgi:hypothetical protein
MMAGMQIDLQRSEYDRGKLDRADLKASPFEVIPIAADGNAG